MQQILIRPDRAAYSQHDETRMKDYLKKANKTGYDIMPGSMLDAGNCKAGHTGIFKLSSKNLGYDFVLVNVDAGGNILGWKKKRVLIYISNIDMNDYSYLQSTGSLLKALELIQNIYCRAAQLHLA